MESLISGNLRPPPLKLEDFDQLNIYIQNLELCFEHSKSVSHFENRSFNHIFDEAEFLTRNSISEVLKKSEFFER